MYVRWMINKMSTPTRINSLAVFVIVLMCFTSIGHAAELGRRVLVYTKNQVGKGLFVHDNIKASSEAIKKLGEENDFKVVVSDDPSDFNEANLKQYQVLIFNNTNNEILENEEQKTALQKYVRAGGGVVAIHSASGSMRQWPWFWELVGGKFKRHAKMQTFTLHVKDRSHASTAHLPETFEWTDEFYFLEHKPKDLHVVLAGDLAKLNDPGKEDYVKEFGGEYPLAWCHTFEGGRSFYTTLGHKQEHYSDPKLMKHILGGILWAMGDTKNTKTKLN